MNYGTVIVADDDASIRTVLNHALARAGYLVRTTGNAATLWRWASAGEGDIVITDVIMPDENAFELLPKLKKLRPDLPVIVMSAHNTLMTAINAAERGAFEYLPKPFDLDHMLGVVERAIKSKSVRNAEQASPEADLSLPIVGRSSAMQDIYRLMTRMMASDLPVLISGEPGTGKQLVAKAIHDFGHRKGRPFVIADAARLSEQNFERRLLELATGGTVFLDEIGDVPLDVQARVVRFMQDIEAGISANAAQSAPRVIASTHRDLVKLIAQGAFREDLYFRLNVVPLKVPPLRERSEDIDELVHHFLFQAERSGIPLKSVAPAALEAMRRHPWPGNVRELENFVQRLLATHSEPTITESMVRPLLAELKSAHAAGNDQGGMQLSVQIEAYLNHEFSKLDGRLPDPGLYDRVIRDVERPLILKCLAATRGNQIKAAELLGVNRNTLRSKIRSLDIPLQRG